MVVYRFGKMVSTDFHKLFSKIMQDGITDIFEIQVKETDFYFSLANVDHSQIHYVQDPRLDQVFGINVIPNRVKLRGEWRSYCTFKYDVTTETVTVQRFYKDNLIEECVFVYDTFMVISHTYYGHNPKLNPTTLLLTSNGEVHTYKRHYHLLGKNDYDEYTLDEVNGTISSVSKRTKGKDWYEIWSSTEESDDVASRVYRFDYHDFMYGKQYFGFIPRG